MHENMQRSERSAILFNLPDRTSNNPKKNNEEINHKKKNKTQNNQPTNKTNAETIAKITKKQHSKKRPTNPPHTIKKNYSTLSNNNKTSMNAKCKKKMTNLPVF